jgi:hypothetical protein
MSRALLVVFFGLSFLAGDLGCGAAQAEATKLETAQPGTAQPGTTKSGETALVAWQGPGFSGQEALLPGAVISSFVGQDPAGQPRLWLLVAQSLPAAEAPRSLWRLDLSPQPSLKRQARDLPKDLDQVLGLETTDGAPSPLMLLGGGKLFTLEADGSLRQRLEDPILDGARLRARVGPSAGPSPFLVRQAVGQLHLLNFRDGQLQRATTAALPVSARRHRSYLEVASPATTGLRRPGTNPLYATGPEAHGSRRLRSVLFDPSAVTAEEATWESWSQLPGNEEVAESWYGLLDGRPVLIVTTFSADKLGVFEKHRLRVWRLSPDRTRAGRRPILQEITESRRWNSVEPVIADVNGDGRDDLVLFQTEGMDDDKLSAEAFLGQAGGQFQLTSRRTALATEASSWIFGNDVDGDGAPDLVALEKDQLLLFPGTGKESKKRWIEKQPALRIPLPREAPAAQVVTLTVSPEAGKTDLEAQRKIDSRHLHWDDLDGDGVAEVWILETVASGQSLLRILESFSP